MSTSNESAAEAKWALSLAEWAIPQQILESAPADPWVLPVERFAGRADRAMADPSGMSNERAVEALRLLTDAATVLDVGAGAGAASLPLATWCSQITAVDSSEEMLLAFASRAKTIGVDHTELVGRWPEIASGVNAHDLVVCHHVVYNVPNIGPFLAELTAHARVAVVLELPPRHPLSWMSPLWKQFHGLDRPTSPTIDDLVAILREMEVENLTVDRWVRHDPAAADGSSSESIEDRAVLVTQRLCLRSDREPEVADVLESIDDGYHRELVTVKWSGSA